MSNQTREWMSQRLAMAGTHTYVPMAQDADSCKVCGIGAEYHYDARASDQ